MPLMNFWLSCIEPLKASVTINHCGPFWRGAGDSAGPAL